MPTLKSEFTELADELLNDEFADFLLSVTFELPGGTDPVDGTTTAGASDTVNALREDYTAREIDGNIIQSGDYKLLVENAQFANVDPRKSGITATVEGVKVNLNNAELDSADAAWTLQMRKA
ncbi:MAG: hypothetical protein R3183_13805 [Oleiphilaceae bacterium]|nr:hypothetical protein [Oleiphilaceae bacterium]